MSKLRQLAQMQFSHRNTKFYSEEEAAELVEQFDEEFQKNLKDLEKIIEKNLSQGLSATRRSYSDSEKLIDEIADSIKEMQPIIEDFEAGNIDEDELINAMFSQKSFRRAYSNNIFKTLLSGLDFVWEAIFNLVKGVGKSAFLIAVIAFCIKGIHLQVEYNAAPFMKGFTIIFAILISSFGLLGFLPKAFVDFRHAVDVLSTAIKIFLGKLSPEEAEKAYIVAEQAWEEAQTIKALKTDEDKSKYVIQKVKKAITEERFQELEEEFLKIIETEARKQKNRT
jgi:hypothetical protein